MNKKQIKFNKTVAATLCNIKFPGHGFVADHTEDGLYECRLVYGINEFKAEPIATFGFTENAVYGYAPLGDPKLTGKMKYWYIMLGFEGIHNWNDPNIAKFWKDAESRLGEHTLTATIYTDAEGEIIQ